MFDLLLGRFRPLERQNIVLMLFGSLILLGARQFVAQPFWASGLNKWIRFPTELASSAKYLFANIFQLHLPGGPYAMPFPEVMAWLSGFGEIILPVLLVFGILSRPAALGILAMTLIIQITIPDGWTLHIQWAAAALLVLVCGPGAFSLDWLLRQVPFVRRLGAAKAV